LKFEHYTSKLEPQPLFVYKNFIFFS